MKDSPCRCPLFLVAEVDWKEAQHRLRVHWVVVHRGKVYVAWATLIVTIVGSAERRRMSLAHCLHSPPVRTAHRSP